MTINRSKLINAPAEKIFSVLSDFNHWSAWSPWLIMEPECKVTVRDDAKYYEWDGKRIGSGNMTIINERENEQIDYDLAFLKPWKSKSKVSFHLKPVGDQTEVAWSMDSSLPFFMFWMKKMMEAFVGMDYDRGLNMLKEYLENGEISSKLEFKGTSNFPGTQYIGIKTTCSFDEIGEKMMADFGRIEEFMKENQNIATGQAFSIYHDWNMVKKQATYTGCVSVKSVPSDLPSGMISGEIPATSIYTMRHIGEYHHLGNAWSTLYAMHRGKEFKPNKKIHPFEHYISNPQETDPKDIITDIHFAVK